MRKSNNLDSDGNRVNLGNFDDKGLNLNNNWDDNRNDNLAVSSARHFYLLPKNAFLTEWRFAY